MVYAAMVRKLTSLLFAAVVLGTCSQASAATLRLGFYGNYTGPPSAAAQDVQRSTALGATVARVQSGWATLAPTRPAAPTDPTDPAYRWDALDAAVQRVVAAGQQPFISLTGAPAWAEGPARPAGATPGTWRPDAAAYGQFARALARRYDGAGTAADGTRLPRVTAYQVWNEPNFRIYLAPQWTGSGARAVAASPSIYRGLQNAFYAGVHAAQPQATVVSAGTGPFGDPDPGGARIRPLRFWRDVLSRPTRLDAIAHHPYSTGAPDRPAFDRDDLAIADVHRLVDLVRRRVGPKPLWITEVSYDSSPPDPDGVPSATHARWVAQTLSSLQRQGARVVIWYRVTDDLPTPSYAATNQSGMYLADGRAKPSARAFAFPVAAGRRPDRTGPWLWARAPVDGPVELQIRRRGRWSPLARVRAHRGEVIERRLPRGGVVAVRARAGATASLSYALR